MRIAICDENEMDAGVVEFALLGLDRKLQIERFASGRRLLARVREGAAFDCVYMDVCLADESGMDVARELAFLSPSTQVVFCTASEDHAVEAFRLRAVDYIVKPVSELDVVRAFARVGVARQREGRVLLRSAEGMDAVYPKEVLRLAADRHYVVVHLLSGRTIRVHTSFSEMLQEFGRAFVEIKRGHAVNMEHVRRIRGSSVELVDKSAHPIANSRKDGVVRSYAAYVTLG